MKADTLLLVTESPLLETDKEDWGLSYFAARGIRPVVWDMSAIVFPHVTAFRDVDYRNSDVEVVRIHTDDEFEQRLADLSPSTFAVWNVPFVPNTESCTRALGAATVPFCCQRLAPTLQTHFVKVAPPQSLRWRLVRRLQPSRLRTSLRWRTFHLKQQFWRRRYRAPAFALIAGADTAGAIDYPRLDGVPTRPARCEDFNRYRRLRDSGQDLSETGTCVFLESSTLGKVEHEMFGQPRLSTADIYYPSLCCLFDQVEAQTGLKVVIAEHPRYVNETAGLDPRYGGRRAVARETALAIARSSLVLTRGSNAVNFAVLFNKPLAFVIPTRSLTPAHIVMAQHHASYFNMPLVDIDDEVARATIDFAKVTVDRGIYARYTDAFISAPGALDCYSWEILADAIERV